MLEIYKTVKTVVEEKFASSTDEFKSGCATVMRLFEHGIKKHQFINVHIENRKLQKKVHELESNLSLYKVKMQMLRESMEDEREKHKAQLAKLIAELQVDLLDKSNPKDLKTSMRKRIYAIMYNRSTTDAEKLDLMKKLTSGWWNL